MKFTTIRKLPEEILSKTAAHEDGLFIEADEGFPVAGDLCGKITSKTLNADGTYTYEYESAYVKYDYSIPCTREEMESQLLFEYGIPEFKNEESGEKITSANYCIQLSPSRGLGNHEFRKQKKNEIAWSEKDMKEADPRTFWPPKAVIERTVQGLRRPETEGPALNMGGFAPEWPDGSENAEERCARMRYSSFLYLNETTWNYVHPPFKDLKDAVEKGYTSLDDVVNFYIRKNVDIKGKSIDKEVLIPILKEYPEFAKNFRDIPVEVLERAGLDYDPMQADIKEYAAHFKTDDEALESVLASIRFRGLFPWPAWETADGREQALLDYFKQFSNDGRSMEKILETVAGVEPMPRTAGPFITELCQEAKKSLSIDEIKSIVYKNEDYRAYVGRTHSAAEIFGEPDPKFFVNCSERSVREWSGEQLEDAENYGVKSGSPKNAIADIPLPIIMPETSGEDMEKLIEEYFEKIKELNPVGVICTGDPRFEYSLNKRLAEAGVDVLYVVSMKGKGREGRYRSLISATECLKKLQEYEEKSGTYEGAGRNAVAVGRGGTAGWTERQRRDAESYGNVVEYGFLSVPANIHEERLAQMAADVSTQIKRQEPAAVVCGESGPLPFLMCHAMDEAGIPVMAERNGWNREGRGDGMMYLGYRGLEGVNDAGMEAERTGGLDKTGAPRS